MTQQKYMKVHSGFGQYHKKYPHCPKQVPMGLLNEKQAQINHSQSLDRLNERGGLDPIELVCNIECRKYPFSENPQDEEYIDKLIKYVKAFEEKEASKN
jgi:hypothetical protein